MGNSRDIRTVLLLAPTLIQPMAPGCGEAGVLRRLWFLRSSQPIGMRACVAGCVRPERTQHRSRTSNDMTEQTEYYELDVSEPQELGAPTRGAERRLRMWWPRRRPIAIIAALAAGVALGAVGVEKE